MICPPESLDHIIKTYPNKIIVPIKMIRSLLLLPLLAWVAVSDRWITAYD